MTPEETGARANDLFNSGLNCAESVLTAVMEHLGVTGDWFPRVATGFGSGIARTGEVCGAFTGAMIAAGWVLGRNDPAGSTEEIYQLGATLIGEFIDRFGSTSCKKLIGVDLSDEYERNMARETGRFVACCTPLVEFSAAWTAQNLQPKIAK
jgi:C_GCAxxG_C_C family probable redox protein